MSGSGKTTLSSDLELYFLEKKAEVYVLDGDDIRGQDKEKLGFGHDDVLKNNLRIAHLCQKLREEEEYDAIVVPVISPYDDIRLQVREILEPNFHLIYLKSDIKSLRERDPKGLYAAADRGIIHDLIGYSTVNPYEEPKNAEIVIDTGSHIDVDKSAELLLKYVNNYIYENKPLY